MRGKGANGTQVRYDPESKAVSVWMYLRSIGLYSKLTSDSRQ